MQFIKDQDPTILDILNAFPSCDLPVTAFMSNVGKLYPRFFSVANYDALKETVRIAFNVTNYTTQSGQLLRGVCSSWLEQYSSHFKIPLFNRPLVNFTLPDPQTDTRPMLWIATGTGITPFISFMEYLKVRFLFNE